MKNKMLKLLENHFSRNVFFFFPFLSNFDLGNIFDPKGANTAKNHVFLPFLVKIFKSIA